MESGEQVSACSLFNVLCRNMILTQLLSAKIFGRPQLEGFAVARGPAGPDQKSVTGAGIEQ